LIGWKVKLQVCAIIPAAPTQTRFYGMTEGGGSNGGCRLAPRRHGRIVTF
jgi:hypothetical protein